LEGCKRSVNFLPKFPIVLSKICPSETDSCPALGGCSPPPPPTLRDLRGSGRKSEGLHIIYVINGINMVLNVVFTHCLRFLPTYTVLRLARVIPL